MIADGKGVQRLTNNSAEDRIPVWSPDGSKIILIIYQDDNFEVYVMNADGSKAHRLTNN
jgi:TolB protein